MTDQHQNGTRWDFWIDRGGTFTDIVARKPDGALIAHKLLSDNPELYEDAALQGIRELMKLEADASLSAAPIAAVKMGTTVATNALLERKGERVLFLTTRGFADALRIGYQNRPHLFRLKIEKPDMLFEQSAEVPERVTAEGEVLTPLDEAATRTALKTAYAAGIRAVAICFLHGYRHPAHEISAARIANDVGFTQISTSHGVSPLMKFVSRGDTTVVDAYLSPILKRYVERIATTLGEDTRLLFMQSSGGLTDATLFEGKDAILSGPAGGVVGAVETARIAGINKLIGFDMGGTSTDVCHYEGTLERSFETEVAGVRMRAPMMQIHTVAAGGGSILHFDHDRLRVGPDSAGANPGPAAYRRGGPLTVTDANVMVGKLLPAFFPHIFGKNGTEPLDADTVHARFTQRASEVGRSAEDTADGYIRIAVENMAQAIKKISVQRGHYLASYALVCFGGAGGQHACLVADALGMTRVFFHPLSGVLSAYGMGLADIRASADKAIEAPLDGDGMAHVAHAIKKLGAETRAKLAAQGIVADKTSTNIMLHLRYAGTDTALLIAHGELDLVRARFETAHKKRFGFIAEEKPVIIEAVTVEAIGHDAAVTGEPIKDDATATQPASDHVTQIYTDGAWRETPVFHRATLKPGNRIEGPAIIIEPHQTIVIEPEWQGEVTPLNHIMLTRAKPKRREHAIGTEVDPVMLEIFNNLFMSIAEQMGFTLEKTAFSVNIKERLDFSCAIFDRSGGLVANAPHMPVHLGSMGASVRAVMEQNPDMARGDVYVLNAPYNGGTHLPDVTVVAPVFLGDEPAPTFYVAARGHQADIGGISPGSMPAHSKNVEEEGVLIDNFQLVAKGRFREKEMRALLSSGRWPARNPDQNIADLRAEIAACEKGAQELRKMVDEFGLDTVEAYMAHVQDNAEESVRRVIDRLKDASFVQKMDDGSEIHVAVSVNPKTRSARIDFTGTSAQRPSNLNAPSAVARAAVLYVFRCMVDDDIPLNEGCLKPLDIVIPEGSMLAPAYPAAVVGGNVETSQAVTDALFGAFGVMASAQGTMNNLTFGNQRHQYYETICGGAGAGANFDGADAIHTHMTNSRLTDPEILEWRFPVLLRNFAIRRGSGGTGKHRGGDGVIREISFREAMTVSILSTHRRIAPFGLAGGGDAACGENAVERANGETHSLEGSDQIEAAPGDTIIVRTPGGGGFGES
jgi:5-oxoprolinase (ATP-hydrolysing)